MEKEKSKYFHLCIRSIFMIVSLRLAASTATNALPPLDQANTTKLNTVYNSMSPPGSISSGSGQNIDNSYVNCNIR